MTANNKFRKSRLKTFSPVKLKRARIKRGLSLAGLGERVGIAKQSIAQYERGDNLPTLENFFLLAHELGVEPSELIKDYRAPKKAGATVSP